MIQLTQLFGFISRIIYEYNVFKWKPDTILDILHAMRKVTDEEKCEGFIS